MSSPTFTLLVACPLLPAVSVTMRNLGRRSPSVVFAKLSSPGGVRIRLGVPQALTFMYISNIMDT
ncbi:exported protein of unknown function [Candidatus Methylomirabilis oxygeniifera]|uniref:Uncharacterized protein n=1 Tax=Methylomirabilis oxygeniifera TaxID=671143 RepID=D5MK90_METO1|nr:exported protein of unknown function [Candidatus Methylomirabilis oxyfera]